MKSQQYLLRKSFDSQLLKTILLIKKIKFKMAQNYNSLPSNRENEPFDLGKVYTEPTFQAEKLNTFELTPLKNSSYQNKMNKTAKIVRLRCGTKTDVETASKTNLNGGKTKFKTQTSQENAEKTFYKKENQLYSTLKKNHLKTVLYKSNRVILEQKCLDNNEKLNTSDVMPKSRKDSVSFSQQKKMQNSRYFPKEDDNKSSKSKRKIEFTVYQSRKKSQSKIKEQEQPALNKSGLFKHIESVYNLPYPFSSNIVIDLFNRKSAKKLNASSVILKEKSFSRDKSKEREKDNSLRKNLQKNPISIKNQQRIENTFQKLNKFQIVKEYTNRGQIENLLRGFILAEEPQCKWALLVIDFVFKKIRNPEANDKI